jgi:hypothetical protein
MEPCSEQMTDERQYGYFQQDNAMARNSTSALKKVCDGRIISTGLWPPRLPDLSVCDFYLWGNLKGKVYRNTPCIAYLWFYNVSSYSEHSVPFYLFSFTGHSSHKYLSVTSFYKYKSLLNVSEKPSEGMG